MDSDGRLASGQLDEINRRVAVIMAASVFGPLGLLYATVIMDATAQIRKRSTDHE